MSVNTLILGSIIGDVEGSIYEWNNIKTKDFPLPGSGVYFTDDSVLTIASMECIMAEGDYASYYRSWGRKYPEKGYGNRFASWLKDNNGPYNSFGNGSAMRVGPVGWAFSSLEDTLKEAKRSAEVTHNHPEGIKGAQATAAAVYLLRIGESKETVKEYISNTFNYDLNRSTNSIRPKYEFNVSCQGTVPEAIIAFLESTDFEDAIRLAISLGGDSDTLACICGAMAEAYYKYIPDKLINNTLTTLTPHAIAVIKEFSERFLR
jgi:ADP-ribosylglycohydrolase